MQQWMLPPLPYGPPQWPIGSQQFLWAANYSHGDHCKRNSPSPSLLPQLQEQEARVDKEVTLQTNISSSCPDEAVIPPPPSYADYFKVSGLIKLIAD